MTRAIIVEDEGVAARRMQRLLEARDFQIIETIVSIQELEDFLKGSTQADIFFMDIHLSDGVVFDLLSKANIETPIIFTTAYDQYAIKAFKQNSIDYLMKPIDEEELDAAINKYKKSSKKMDLSLLSSLLSNQQSQQSYKERISVKVGDKIRSIKMAEVQFFYSADKSNYLFQNEGRSYLIDYSIEEIYKQLDPKEFFRVSRGYIVSISSITDVIAYSNSRLKIKIEKAEKHEIIVARDRVKDFKEWLG
jgi:DNA-binding LytR/AlgR family response regulator